MRIDILYFDGCPNHPPTAELVRSIVQALHIQATIQEIEVRDADEAMRLRFFGSPTVQVNGRDIEPEARGRTGYAMSCRTYGRTGSPSRELVEEALRDGMAEERGEAGPR